MKSLFPFALIATIAAAGSLAQAQSFNVKKMKGKQAIIQMTSGTFTEGQSVTVGGSGDSSGSYSGGGGGSGSRNNFIGVAGGVTMTKTTTTVGTTTSTATTTAIAADITYGWNKGTMEYGVLGGIGMTSGGAKSTTAFAVGGVFDYNFTENRPGVDGILCIGVIGKFASADPTTTITIFPALGYKWFPLGNASAIRFDGGMQLTQVSVSGASTSDTQPAVRFGIETYF